MTEDQMRIAILEERQEQEKEMFLSSLKDRIERTKSDYTKGRLQNIYDDVLHDQPLSQEDSYLLLDF